MFTGIVTALGEVRTIEPLGGGRDMRLVIARTLARHRGDRARRLDRLRRLLPHGGRGRAGLVRRRCLGRNPLPIPRSGAGGPARALNLERSLRVGDELGGHIVSGHVDGLGELVSASPENGSTRLLFRAPDALARFIAVKGSIAVDGVSLTVNEVQGSLFGVNIIPHTAAVTTLGRLAAGDAGQYRDRHAGALRRPPRGCPMRTP